jgi:predicted ArsR family transcriptional regulator
VLLRSAPAGGLPDSDITEVTRRGSAGRWQSFCGSYEPGTRDLWGALLAACGADLAELLGISGYEPRHGPGGCIHLANCPFGELAARHTGLVCTMNLHLLRGLLAGLGSAAQARLDPAEGRCCVTITLP